ncbi:single-stranded-DNA-specific exonuclease RecJ [Halanaerobium sp. Z-7514]|uniref:Single-stranded-DNA-specific exonuclease RecJ n=1 Tax=Halanaerobium polyolivorans TaxID=2886943 RepID=A0AAW4X0P1_9FIRM|nr:single-stranded-DNA-specific exonuclease RecJ [Halanaerobium polyolivorans]MCC3145361.1 single-stranded-DNA-specific exonuclease RecJ [Halanaerobium polyolivorans]
MNKFWQIKKYENNIKSENLIDYLLEERAFTKQEDKEIFLSSDLKYLSDPFLLPGMDKAVELINKSLNNKEKILIYGDYDVDGITSTALLYKYFKSRFNIEVDYFIPDRIENGYGLSKKAVHQIKARDIDLIITVDCGITAFKEVELIKELGMKVIITDHHTPAETPVGADAVINHHLIKEKNHFLSEIAGVGTAFKLLQALEKDRSFELEALAKDFLPIVALGTIADIAPLKAENRIIVKHGLKMMQKAKNLGLKTLIDKLNIDSKRITSGQVGYIIAPPINAAGRIYHADKALELLITDDHKKAAKIADSLIKINRERQQEEELIYQQALEKIKSIKFEEQKAIILADQRWHSGIIGIVASKLVEEYNLPVILIALTENKEQAKASARSIEKLNIYQALKAAEEYLLNFGGHKAAAGFSIRKDKIADFKEAFNNYLKQNLAEEDFFELKKIDLNLDIKELNKDLINKLEVFSPFGVANPRPKFLFQNLKLKNYYKMGKKNNHLKIKLNSNLSAVAFNMGDYFSELAAKKIDVIAQAEINHWQGRENIQLKISDLRKAGENIPPLVFTKKDYKIYDFRNNKNKEQKLNYLLKDSFIDKAAVYVNKKELKKKLQLQYKAHYFFSEERKNKECFSHLIFYSLPFCLEHLNEIITNFTDKKKKIILLFSEKEIPFNFNLIKHKCPSREMMEEFMLLLSNINPQQGADINLNLIKKEYELANSFNLKNSTLFNQMLKIAAELDLFDLKSQVLKFKPEQKNQLDFKASLRYNKLSRQIEKFSHFKDIVFAENLFALIENLNNFKEEENES